MDRPIGSEEPAQAAPSPDRRVFLRAGAVAGAAALAAACAPTAAPPAPAPAGAPAAPAGKPAWEEEWDRLVKAAQQEGKLALVTTVGAGFREAIAEFQQRFPGIQVDHTGLQASAFTPRYLQEREASIQNYDAMTSTWAIVPRAMAEKGYVAPIRSMLARPDVLDDKSWRGGFAAGFLDGGEKWVYAGFQEKSEILWINTDIVKDGEIKRVEDLLDAKWKGKIVGGDPRSFGGGFVPATAMRLALGNEILKRLYKDQEVTLGRDQRQLTEFMVRGRFPIGVGAVYRQLLDEFLPQGLGRTLKNLDEVEHVDYVGGGSNVVWVFDKAPHPNAAKLFANWLLTKEGQTIWSKHALTNSRRVDVAPAVPNLAPKPGRKYMQSDSFDIVPELAKTQELAKAALN